MEGKKNGRLKVVGMLLLLVVVGYVAFAWQVFCVKHPTAGDGAFFVYFVEFVTFGDVDKLRNE
jgi:hypothetical protein